MSGILDIPDEPPRQWRSLPSAAAAGVVAVAIGAVVARTFALAGMPRGRVLVGLCMPVLGAVVAWFVAGPHRWRTAVTAAVMVLGVVTMPFATAGITPSPARLSAAVDHLGLPGTTVHEMRLGNGRCRPSCSEVRRVSIARGSSFVKVSAELQGALRGRDFTVKLYAHQPGAPTVLTAEAKRLSASFEIRVVSLDETRIAATFIAKGPAPHHSVG